MKEDFSELVQYLDGKFNAIDGKFVDVDKQFKEIRGEFGDLKKDFNNLQVAIDGYAVKADTYFQEMVALSHKVDRHEKWLLQLADKLGVKLQY